MKNEEEQKAVAIVKAWMLKHGYSTGGGDNIGYLLLNLESQMWDRVRLSARRDTSCPNRSGI